MANHQYFFFYAPTWDYPPGGPIKLGNIIASVKTPHRPIHYAPLEGVDISSTKKGTTEYTKEKFRGGKFSVLTKFLSVLGLGIDVGAEVDKSDGETFTFKTIETTQFTPTPLYLQKCIEDDGVRRFLKISRYRKPVYLITGLKVVTGAEANTHKSRAVGGSVAVEVDGTIWSGGTVPIGGGPGVEGKRGSNATVKWEGSDDFVFAFRVSQIFVGEATGQVVSEEEYCEGALLGSEEEQAKRSELCILKVEDPDPDAHAERFGLEKLIEDEDVVLCAVPKEEDSDG